MNAPGIYLLTRQIHTGKTTAIMDWAADKDDVYGIVTPIINGDRVFMDIHSGHTFPMLAAAGEKDILAIGKYSFSKKSFDKAIDIIRQSLQQKSGWVIIDECGPMELKNEGFYDVIHEAITNENLKLLIVVRDTILEDMIHHFNLNRFIIKKKACIVAEPPSR